ncbi:Os06g0126700 [Oryza sativa Japonica Group]|uniref:Os06g0126700 protein n=1 Tax=Oryza sativa subsp. japonica TaxID=39947 RepID=A0A0N7KLG2_ORYSJ|nr:Os06g0126700 [Oryza sativa Japonica Group]
MYPTCHSSPPLSSSSTLQSPARASGVSGGDAAEAVAKASSRPAAAPSLPCRTWRATTTAWAGRSRRRRSHCGKREVGGGGGKAAAIGGWTILADRLLISSRCADLGTPHQSRGGGGSRSVTAQMVAMVAASDDGGAGAMQERIVGKEMGG